MSSQHHPDLDQPYMHLLDEVTFQPVFIMGAHRTGTTILYKILGDHNCFNTVTIYHILKYHELLYHHAHHAVAEAKRELAAIFRQRGLTDRIVDGIAVNPDTPEEYGFIFHDAGYRPRLRPGNLHDLATLCKKVQLTSDPARPILLKNPWDYFLNFLYVKQAFPHSMFIFIHRHPLATINSQIKILRSLLSARNEYVALYAKWYAAIFQQPLRLRIARFLISSHFNLGLNIITRHVTLGSRYFMRYVSSLPPSDYLCVRYEDLCRDPKSTVAQILAWLGLSESPDVQSIIDPRPVSLLPEVERNRAAIFRKMKGYFEHWQYQIDDPCLG